jgi:hypothetical protein
METVVEPRVKIDFKTLDIDEHAVRRAVERFKRKDKYDALNYFKSLLGHSKYMGETTCEKGNQAHMFVAPNKVAIYLTLDMKTIKTAMKINDKPYIVYSNKTNEQASNTSRTKEENPLQDKLIKLYTTEFKKYDRLEKKIERQFTRLKLESDIKLSELRLLLFKARSEQNKMKYQAQITDIEKNLKLNEEQLRKVQGDKRKISRALATLLSE